MAEAFSVIASVVGVSAAASQISKALFELVDGIRSAPEEIKAISRDTHAFYDLVFSLETALKDDDIVSVIRENAATVDMMRNLEQPLRNCSTTLGQLMLKIRARVKPSFNGQSSRFTGNVQWYFQKKDIKESLDRLGQNKATLNTALNMINTICHFRHLAAPSQEPNDWSSLVNGCGSQNTDVGFTLRRFILETEGPDSIAPPTVSESDDLSLVRGDESESLPDIEPDNQVVKIRSLGRMLNRTIEPDEVLLGRIAEPRTTLHKAAKTGDNLAVLEFLSQGADVNAKDRYGGGMALHIAAECGNEEVVLTLLNHGAEVNAENYSQDKMTALHMAAMNGHNLIIQLLLDHGADILAKTTYNGNSLHLATMAGHVDAAKVLIDNGASLDARNDNGSSPLHCAIISRTTKDQRRPQRLEAARYLLAHGANTETTGKYGYTPLILAATEGFASMVQLLLKNGANIKARGNSYRWTSLHYASYCDEEDSEKLEAARYLLAHGADIEATNKAGFTPLLIAAQQGSVSMVQFLLNKRANVEVQDNRGWTPLHCASSWFIEKNASGLLEVGKSLLAHGANVNAPSRTLTTPLFEAIRAGFDSFAQLLMENGANVKASDRGYWTPLHRASTMKKGIAPGQLKIGESLLAHGADIDALTHGSGLHYTPLHLAAGSGFDSMVQLLISKRANLNVRDKTGLVALHYAVFCGHYGIVRMLLNSGDKIDVDVRGSERGETPLLMAVARGRTAVTRLLLERGADVLASNKKGENAFQLARRCK